MNVTLPNKVDPVTVFFDCFIAMKYCPRTTCETDCKHWKAYKLAELFRNCNGSPLTMLRTGAAKSVVGS